MNDENKTASVPGALARTRKICHATIVPMTLDQIINETNQLPQDVRAELVERIILLAHGSIAPRIEEAWKLEARRRIAEIKSGQTRGIPLDQALAEARKRVGL